MSGAGDELAAVLPFTRPAPADAVLGRDGRVEETTAVLPADLLVAGALADVLDAYARQPDQIAALVEAWQQTLPDTDGTRAYAAAVLHALGELHVALDTAAHLTRLRIPLRPGAASPAPAVPTPLMEQP